MSPIVELICEVRKRPANYIGDQSIFKLAAFLRGYDYALSKFNLPRDHFLSEFRDWVARRFSVTISRSWESIIWFHSADDNEAMQMFSMLVDEFVAANPQYGKGSQDPNGTVPCAS